MGSRDSLALRFPNKNHTDDKGEKRIKVYHIKIEWVKTENHGKTVSDITP